jgi:pimeloyl-ACP methyl ester carboxylesterase
MMRPPPRKGEMLNHQPDDRVVDRDRDRMISVDGRNVHVVENGPPGAPAVLLIHGFASSTVWWDSLVPELAQHHHVIRVDLLGHGRSDSPADGYTIWEQGQLVGSVLTRLGVDRVIAIGHSTGGMVATALAEQRRDAVAAMVLIDTGPSTGAFIPQNALYRLMFVPLIGPLLWRLRTETTIRKGLSTAFTADVDIPAQIIANVRAMTYRAFSATPKETMKYVARRSIPARLAELTIPALVVFGALDRRWRSSSGAEYDLVPEVEVKIIPGVGHSPMIEAPGRTGQLLGDFITTVTGQHHGRT